MEITLWNEIDKSLQISCFSLLNGSTLLLLNLLCQEYNNCVHEPFYNYERKQWLNLPPPTLRELAPVSNLPNLWRGVIWTQGLWHWVTSEPTLSFILPTPATRRIAKFRKLQSVPPVGYAKASSHNKFILVQFQVSKMTGLAESETMKFIHCWHWQMILSNRRSDLIGHDAEECRMSFILPCKLYL